MSILIQQKRRRSRVLQMSAMLAACISIAGAVLAGPLDDAKSAYRNRDYSTAQRLAGQAAQENPNDPGSYVVIGSARAKLGDKSGAREAWGNVLRLDPDLKSVKNKSGFMKAYQSVGGQASGGNGDTPSSAGAGNAGAAGSVAGVHRDDGVQGATGDRGLQVPDEQLGADLLAADVPLHQGLVLGLLDDPLDERPA